MRYSGQNYERDVPLPAEEVDAGALQRALARFIQLHESFYGFSIEGETIELINFRLTAIGPTEGPDLPTLPTSEQPPRPIATRDVYFAPHGFVSCPVFRRGELGAGATLIGPAIVEDIDATTVVYPGDTLEVTPSCVLIINRRGDSA